jgi:hypothetical protein
VAVFFNRWATSASLAHTPRGRTIHALDFSKPATDGVATDSSDLYQSRDAAAPPLECKQSHEAPPIFFVQTCDDSIDGLVFFSHGTVWVLLASLTNASMNTRLAGFFHARSSCYSPDEVYFICQVIRYELFVKSSSYFLTKPKSR